MHLRILSLSAALSVVLTSAAPTAVAQKYLLGASASGSSGIEGGGPLGTVAQTRTRVRLGGDVRVDESPEDAVLVGLDAEIAASSGIGADLRYGRILSDRFLVNVGVLGIVAPYSLYGAVGAIEYRIPLSKRVQITLSPEGDFFFLGSDLPDGTIIWQVRFNGGLRADL